MRSPTYFSRIDGLRGFLALYVMIHHLSTVNGIELNSNFSLINQIIHYGYEAPKLFFVLSGFLIINSYRGDQNTHVFGFYVKRFFRIFPVFWFVLGFEALLNLVPVDHLLLKNAFFITCLLPYDMNNLPIFVSWSIFVEEIFYITVPLYAGKITRKSSLIGLVVFCLTSFLWFSVFQVPKMLSYLRWDTPLSTFHYFFAGIAIWFWQKESLFEKVFRADFVKRFHVLDIMVVGYFVLSAAVFKLSFPFVLGSLFLLSALDETSFLAKSVWDSKWLKWFGKRCFSLYMIHVSIIRLWISGLIPLDDFVLFNQLTLNGRSAVILVFEVATILISCEIVFRFIERPFIQLGKKMVQRNSFLSHDGRMEMS